MINHVWPKFWTHDTSPYDMTFHRFLLFYRDLASPTSLPWCIGPTMAICDLHPYKVYHYNTRCTIHHSRYQVYDTKITIHPNFKQITEHHLVEVLHHYQWEPSMQITPSDYLDGLLIVHYYVDPLLIDISALINREPFIYLHGTPFTDRPSLVLSSPSCSFLRALIIFYYFSSISLSAQNWVVMKWYVKFLCQKYHASNFLGISGCFPVNSYHGKLGFPGQKAQQNICPQKKLLTNEKNKQSMFRAAISYFAISGQWQV